MGVRRRLSGPVLASTVIGAVVAATTNIATGVFPESWRPYLWLAWPALGVLVVVLVILDQVVHRRSEPVQADKQAVAIQNDKPAVAIQNIEAQSSGSAYGAMFGNVIHHDNRGRADEDNQDGSRAQ
jgi:hypothetical protein